MNVLEKSSLEMAHFNLGMQKRRYRRNDVAGMIGEISGGNTVMRGNVTDISVGGFKISNIPANFDADKHAYKTVLSCRGRHFKLLVTPCWQRQGSDPYSIEIGFKILDSTWEWVEFSAQTLSVTEEGIGFHA